MAFYCPCCGFRGLVAPAYSSLRSNQLIRGLTPPYSEHFGMPSYEVCPCCGFEFGNDDEPGTAEPVSFEQYLQEWIDEGCNWLNESLRPDDWSLVQQLGTTSTNDDGVNLESNGK